MSVVDGVGFQELMAVAGPRCTIPSHTFLSQTMLPAKYAELFAKAQSVLTIVPYCSITTDMWSSKFQSRGYVTVTCHVINDDWKLRTFVLSTEEVADEHTAANLEKILDNILKEWKIHNRVVGTTTDNGSNIIKAMSEMGFLNMPCVGHTLNLAVKKCFEIHSVDRALA